MTGATHWAGHTFRHLIAGELVAGTHVYPVINPATGTNLADAPGADHIMLDRAVAAAQAALPGWQAQGFDARRDALLTLKAAIEARAEDLATLLTAEQGKPLVQARDEITRGAEAIAKMTALKIEPELLDVSGDKRTELVYRPLGVIGAITLWNVPFLLAIPKLVSALYCGNAIVLKPSPLTPLTTLLLGEIAAEIFPPGIVNIIAGEADFGAWMSTHPGIAKINFTGSVATGQKIMASAAPTLKRLTLELGGNDAAIVLADADIDAFAPRLINAAFKNSGQICQAIKRLYVEDAIYEPMVAALTKATEALKIGAGTEPGVDIGPIQNQMQFDRLKALQDETRALPEVRITTGGHALNRAGYFIAPTIVADIAEGTRLVDEEQFGPILPVIRCASAEDALMRANDSPFGLGGSVWTADIARGTALAQRMETGVAWVNHHLGLAVDFPFGGVKTSGIGRAKSILGLKAHMEAQVVQVPEMPG
ncbi:aldehyde dehydrogenase family protein [Marivita sp. S6314]|uniref:aldehyde dehydrogenase family protein n=1 Tax=Marivita sp. S6314 TaxID=2926406 RepID=UPI001FF57CD0|nr:aldehyde dehydrogenase family protein [Marivita sp. S6314]MCK0150875.1 aldehyde dehydrogenase family protein [Marivita sp. S6314]